MTIFRKHKPPTVPDDTAELALANLDIERRYEEAVALREELVPMGQIIKAHVEANHLAERIKAAYALRGGQS